MPSRCYSGLHWTLGSLLAIPVHELEESPRLVLVEQLALGRADVVWVRKMFRCQVRYHTVVRRDSPMRELRVQQIINDSLSVASLLIVLHIYEDVAVIQDILDCIKVVLVS